MKIGDLVKLRFGASLPGGVGIIIEEFVHDLADRDINEVRVQWLDYAGKDVSWVRPKDLEVLGENR